MVAATISAGTALTSGGPAAPVIVTSRPSPTGTIAWEAESDKGGGGPMNGGAAGTGNAAPGAGVGEDAGGDSRPAASDCPLVFG
jgi:hypothetical protein